MIPVVKYARWIAEEFSAIAAFSVRTWPNTRLGRAMRKAYWRRKTGSESIFVARGGNLGDCLLLEIGEHVEFGENAELVVDTLPVHFGSYITIARSFYLRSSNHRFDDLERPIMEQGHTTKSVSFRGKRYSVVIEDDVWIGANVIVLGGTWIGTGSVIAAGSIVNGVIPPFSIAAGTPARVIKSRRLEDGAKPLREDSPSVPS